MRQMERNPDMAGAETAMRRAARRARLRAAQASVFPPMAPQATLAVGEFLGALAETDPNGTAAHLRRASEQIDAGDWTESVRESICVVESVARELDPDAAAALDPALKAIAQHGALHPALKAAFSKLYGYTSDAQGIRHALLDRPDARVGQDEAVFMLGACAAFASYLWRKHAAGEPR